MKWRSASTVNGVSRTVNVPAFDDGVQDADDLRGIVRARLTYSRLHRFRPRSRG
ncbi:MAG TPA: hypothetical protein VJH87_04175 [Vicinamibacteria bacterium]|nr:hypothetical protein [Vicinamibacteria bacterium]